MAKAFLFILLPLKATSAEYRQFECSRVLNIDTASESRHLMTINGDTASSDPRFVFFAGLVPLTILFVVSGVLHLLWPQPYLRIMPPFLPWPKALVWISGFAEIMGGVGLLMPKFRRTAAYGLVALLIGVFPANVYMAVAHVPFSGLMGASWAQWLRLPLQIPLILWALYYARKDAPPPSVPIRLESH